MSKSEKRATAKPVGSVTLNEEEARAVLALLSRVQISGSEAESVVLLKMKLQQALNGNARNVGEARG